MPVTIENIIELFDAVSIYPDPAREEKVFIRRRNEIERKMPDFLTIEEYLRYFKLFKKYGLENVMISRVEHEIWYMANYHSQKFASSRFYQINKDTKLVRKHFDETNV